MADSPEPRDTSIPDPAANKEPAEGPRENENVESGISNRPIREEQRDQQDMPPRRQNHDEVNS
jgi:hypothetical protein